MLVVDARHWLTEDPSTQTEPRFRRQVLRIARLIEAGGPLAAGEARETLVECSLRPGRRPCPGLLWVVKEASDGPIHAWCIACGGDEVQISGWEETDWAEGPMPPIPLSLLLGRDA